jgi:hypothetical protein
VIALQLVSQWNGCHVCRDDLTARFTVRDHNGQQLAYVYYEEEPGRRSAAKLLSKDEARRIAANVAKLPELLQWRAAKRRAVEILNGQPRLPFREGPLGQALANLVHFRASSVKRAFSVNLTELTLGRSD